MDRDNPYATTQNDENRIRSARVEAIAFIALVACIGLAFAGVGIWTISLQDLEDHTNRLVHWPKTGWDELYIFVALVMLCWEILPIVGSVSALVVVILLVSRRLGYH